MTRNRAAGQPGQRHERTVAWGLCLSSVLAVTTAGGCATTQYNPDLVARGELTLRYQAGFQIYAGRDPLASGPTYRGLEHYVRCVPQAREHAQKASSSGRAAIATSVLGGVFGAAGLMALVGLYDTDHLGAWLAGGLGSSSVGLVFSILSYRKKNHANGHAIDSLNFYNDAVGSLGATCDDLRYPAPAGPAPPDSPPAGADAATPAPDPASLPPPPTAP